MLSNNTAGYSTLSWNEATCICAALSLHEHTLHTFSNALTTRTFSIPPPPLRPQNRLRDMWLGD